MIKDLDAPLFLDQKKLKEQDDKILSGETICSTDSPEDCESCSG